MDLHFEDSDHFLCVPWRGGRWGECVYWYMCHDTLSPWFDRTIPLRRDLLPQAWCPPHLASQAGAMGFACVSDQHNVRPVDVSQIVLNTIAEARAPSTMWLYALKWKVFSAWCAAKNERHMFHTSDPGFIAGPARSSPSTLKVYVTAIASFHTTTEWYFSWQARSNNRLSAGHEVIESSLPSFDASLGLSLVLNAVKPALRTA